MNQKTLGGQKNLFIKNKNFYVKVFTLSKLAAASLGPLFEFTKYFGPIFDHFFSE